VAYKIRVHADAKMYCEKSSGYNSVDRHTAQVCSVHSKIWPKVKKKKKYIYIYIYVYTERKLSSRK
jgi:hypothetical protein